MLPPRSAEPLGQKRYWPIFEAAVKHGYPIGLHVGGQGGHAEQLHGDSLLESGPPPAAGPQIRDFRPLGNRKVKCWEKLCGLAGFTRH